MRENVREFSMDLEEGSCEINSLNSLYMSSVFVYYISYFVNYMMQIIISEHNNLQVCITGYIAGRPGIRHEHVIVHLVANLVEQLRSWC